ncbi:hypothetical protein SAMN05421812_102637 [Asanoa hainanensis]|uniref:Uncharacterized protein n=1 Tax=Asanoa hainanensis TaxID=560556 RepID=A0A239IYS0_9ACTN|nr:hypothetical protein [Asanoa hainanensis]SNS98709.1 hypothetical protein SAMN05421812_102637 [Asanoa hainanensis]
MSAYLVSVYHNLTSRFMPYNDGDWLTGAISCRPGLGTHATPKNAADWAFHAFNVDLDQFWLPRMELADAEARVAPWVYRIVGLRSLSVGDVVAIETASDGETWVACEPQGWRPITAPTHIDGDPLNVETVRPYLRGQSAANTGRVTEPGMEVHRLCIFDLSLDCGHIATVAVNGWHPVNVACCDRLGGIAVHGDYAVYSSSVDYVNPLSERYEDRQPGACRELTVLLRRRPCTDEPTQPSWHGEPTSAGRFPVRVGATWHIGSEASPSEQ